MCFPTLRLGSRLEVHFDFVNIWCLAGTPPLTKEAWVDQVEWVRGNALEPRTYQHQLEGAVAAISCIGTFGSQDEMYKVSGPAGQTQTR